MQTPIPKVMKRFVLLLFILFFGAEVSWSSSCGDHQFIPIRVLDNTTETGRENRSLEYVPFQAYYDSFTSSIYLSFFENIGEVEISITNCTSGECSEFDFNTSIGTLAIPVSDENGTYQLQINTILVDYIGEFQIE